jgi:ribosome-associated protein
MNIPSDSSLSSSTQDAVFSSSLSVKQLCDAIIHVLGEDKVEDIVVIDLEGKSDMADYMIIGSGRSARHNGATADKLVKRLHQAGYHQVSVEGLPQGDWVLIDIFDIVIHLFHPEKRAMYQLEKMWQMPFPDHHSSSLSAE